ncbi:MAG: DUF2459 domain-containing protein [Paracoccus sp. (in: a-proteobacteria)]
MTWIRRALIGLMAGGTMIFLALLSGAWIPAPGGAEPSGDPVRVGLAQGPIHTDFLLPLDPETRADFARLDLPGEAEWLMVGWGARGFYTAVGGYGDLNIPLVLKAATGDSAVMRFQPVAAFDPPLSIRLDQAQYRRLRQVILSDTDWGQPVGRDLLAPGDRYFAAKGRFNIF